MVQLRSISLRRRDRRRDRQVERTAGRVDRRPRLPRKRKNARRTMNENGLIIEHRWATTVSGVTILLSLTVFLNLVAETLPQVSDAIPLLGTIDLLH